MNKKISAAIMIAVLSLITGCKSQQNITVDPICSPTDKADAIKTAEQVLEKMNFQISKSDIEQGYILTRPLQGGQLFEFWKNDNAGVYNTAEAAIHTIRRTIQLTFTQNGPNLCIDCDVTTEKLHLPTQSVNSSASAYRLFSKSSRSQQTLQLNENQKKHASWIELGADPRLELAILNQIKQKLPNTVAMNQDQ